MTDSTTAPSGSINLLLVLTAALLLGFLGGFLVGQRGPISAATTTVAGPCPNELDPADAYIIAGFICPAPACQDQLSSCHCDIAHKVKDQVKQELGQGKAGSEVRHDLEKQYGARLKPIS